MAKEEKAIEPHPPLTPVAEEPEESAGESTAAALAKILNGDSDALGASTLFQSEFDKTFSGNPQFQHNSDGSYTNSRGGRYSRDSSGQVQYVQGSTKVNITARIRTALDFFQSAEGGSLPAWKAQAWVGNLLGENDTLSPSRTEAGGWRGDIGLAQWDPTRRGRFQRLNGYAMNDPNVSDDKKFKDELKFIVWELNNTHQGAKRAIDEATTTEEVVSAIVRKFEISKLQEKDIGIRTRLARGIDMATKPQETAAAHQEPDSRGESGKPPYKQMDTAAPAKGTKTPEVVGQKNKTGGVTQAAKPPAPALSHTA